jgi:hypothetical protein
MENSDAKRDFARLQIEEKVQRLTHFDPNTSYYSLVQEVELSLGRTVPLPNEFVNLIIDETVTEDQLNREQFTSMLVALLFEGLTKQQKVALFLKYIEEQRYYCTCAVDWDTIKMKFSALIEEIGI